MERGEIPTFHFLEYQGYESPIPTFGSGGVMKAPFNFLEWWVIVDPLTFLGEGGIFSLECPRATAVFGQTVLVWSGVVLRALPLIKPLVSGRGWKVFFELCAIETAAQPALRGGGMLTPGPLDGSMAQAL